MNKNSPIGVFDSGIGGLTVLSDLIERFPNEDFIYVADTKNVPYGIKTPEQIANIVTSVTKYLLKQDVKAIVIACNTATANSVHLKNFTDVPIIGVIEPTAIAALKASKNKNIAILATNATINSGSYQKLINKEGNSFPVKCSDFVPMIESSMYDSPYSYELVRNTIGVIKDQDIDTVILGCTHFGLISKEVKSVFPNANLITSGLPTAEVLSQVLVKGNLENDQKSAGKVIVNTTKSADEMAPKIHWFKKSYYGIYEIEI